jgi:NAD+ synthase
MTNHIEDRVREIMNEEYKEKKILLPQIDEAQVEKEIGDFIIENVLRTGKTGAVIGLSGGVDSTVVAALAKKAFDRYNLNHENKLELVGYILPSNTNSPKDAEDGIKIAETLAIRYEVHSIESVVEAYKTTNNEAFELGFDKGNVMSRVRANILSTKSATEGKTLLGTGNKDEDFGIGYYTLFGDGAVHLSPIGNLSKRLVFQMAHYLGFHETASREPTAGLEPNQTDFKDLGYHYDAVELVLEGKRQGFSPEQMVNHKQVIEMIEPQLEYSKLKSVKDVVYDILRRHHDIALPKMDIIHPPAAKITLRYAA